MEKIVSGRAGITPLRGRDICTMSDFMSVRKLILKLVRLNNFMRLGDVTRAADLSRDVVINHYMKKGNGGTLSLSAMVV